MTLESRRVDREGLRIVQLAGTPEEIGRAHGRLLRSEIRRACLELVEGAALPGIGLELFGWDVEKAKSFVAWAKRKAMRFVPQIPDPLQAEMRALAKEADLSWELAVMAQALLDVAEQAGLVHSQTFFHACTHFALLPPRTRGSVLLGRNLDWPSFGLAHELVVLYHYFPKDGLPFWCLGWAGNIGALTAVNHERLSVTEESLTVTEDVSDEGIPTFLIHRMIAQEEHSVPKAAERLIGLPRTNGYHTLFASGAEERALTVLHSARRHAVRPAREGVCLGVETKRDDPAIYDGGRLPPKEVPLTDETSEFRYARVRQLLDGHAEPVTLDDVERWLGDDLDLATGKPDTNLNCLANETTQQSLAADLTHGLLRVAMGRIPASKGPFVSFRLADELR